MQYPHRVYPALVALPHSNAPGLILTGLTTEELSILDAFEGDEYRRDTIAVETSSGVIDAQVYLPVASISPDAIPWTLEQWTRLHKPAVLAGEQRTARALRERMSTASKPEA